MTKGDQLSTSLLAESVLAVKDDLETNSLLSERSASSLKSSSGEGFNSNAEQVGLALDPGKISVVSAATGAGIPSLWQRLIAIARSAALQKENGHEDRSKSVAEHRAAEMLRQKHRSVKRPLSTAEVIVKPLK